MVARADRGAGGLVANEAQLGLSQEEFAKRFGIPLGRSGIGNRAGRSLMGRRDRLSG